VGWAQELFSSFFFAQNRKNGQGKSEDTKSSGMARLVSFVWVWW
jgi:hypothetical protein